MVHREDTLPKIILKSPHSHISFDVIVAKLLLVSYAVGSDWRGRNKHMNGGGGVNLFWG